MQWQSDLDFIEALEAEDLDPELETVLTARGEVALADIIGEEREAA